MLGTCVWSREQPVNGVVGQLQHLLGLSSDIPKHGQEAQLHRGFPLCEKRRESAPGATSLGAGVYGFRINTAARSAAVCAGRGAARCGVKSARGIYSNASGCAAAKTSTTRAEKACARRWSRHERVTL